MFRLCLKWAARIVTAIHLESVSIFRTMIVNVCFICGNSLYSFKTIRSTILCRRESLNEGGMNFSPNDCHHWLCRIGAMNCNLISNPEVSLSQSYLLE